MRRRNLLKATASATALAAFAGCTQTGDRDTATPNTTDDQGDQPGSQPGAGTVSDADEAVTHESSDSGTHSDDDTGSSDGSAGESSQAWGSGGRMNGVEFSFTSQSPECGQTEDSVDVSFDSDAGEVSLDGVITGSDTCKRATLGSVEHDTEAGELTADIETTAINDCESGGGGVGAQCLVDIEYETTFTLDSDLPSEVTVRHNDDLVTEATPEN